MKVKTNLKAGVVNQVQQSLQQQNEFGPNNGENNVSIL
jgi:hypothetical protein